MDLLLSRREAENERHQQIEVAALTALELSKTVAVAYNGKVMQALQKALNRERKSTRNS